MKKFLSRIKSFFAQKKEQGATMVEYGLMVALIAIALIASVKVLSGGIDEVFTEASTEMKSAIP
jgi:pilus assembly protein Flp/PilA